MDFMVNHAILHVLNRGEVRLSERELDVDSEVCAAFINRHVKKVMTDARAKESTFAEDSPVLGMVNAFMDDADDFRAFSVKLAERLAEIAKEHDEIPPGDLLVVQFDKKDDGYIGVAKINYKECVTHHIGEGCDENAASNQIIEMPSLDLGKAEAACVIPYAPGYVKVTETPVEIGGEPTCYFSEQFLSVDANMSKKDAADIIQNAINEVNALYFNESPAVEGKLKAAVIEEAMENDGAVSVQNVAAKVLGDNEDAKREFFELAKDAGLQGDALLGEKYAKSQFAAVRFKADNGIEVKIPTSVSDDMGVVEFDEHSDGSVTIHVKNLRRA